MSESLASSAARPNPSLRPGPPRRLADGAPSGLQGEGGPRERGHAARRRPAGACGAARRGVRGRAHRHQPSRSRAGGLGECHVDVSHDRVRAIVDASRPVLVPGRKAVVHIHLSGNEKLLRCRTSQFSMNPPAGGYRQRGGQALLRVAARPQARHRGGDRCAHRGHRAPYGVAAAGHRAPTTASFRTSRGRPPPCVASGCSTTASTSTG